MFKLCPYYLNLEALLTRTVDGKNVGSQDIPQELDPDLAAADDGAKNAKIRKRIDDLLEKRRLKQMLDETDDWDV